MLISFSFSQSFQLTGMEEISFLNGAPLSSADGRRADSISLFLIAIVGFSLLTTDIDLGLLTAENGAGPVGVVILTGAAISFVVTGGREAKPRTSGARILRETNGTGWIIIGVKVGLLMGIDDGRASNGRAVRNEDLRSTTGLGSIGLPPPSAFSSILLSFDSMMTDLVSSSRIRESGAGSLTSLETAGGGIGADSRDFSTGFAIIGCSTAGAKGTLKLEDRL